MILPKMGRNHMIKGISALGVIALVTIGMTGFRDSVEPKEMVGKSDADIEALMDPLAEELAYDHSRRALKEYRASKGLFGCEGECVENKRRWLEAERDLLSAAQQRAAARKAKRVRDRAALNGVAVTGGSAGGSAVPSLADRQAAAKARQAARAAKRRGINVKAPAPAPAPGSGGTAPPPSFMSPRAAAQARAAERKAQRAAEKAARLAAANAARIANANANGGSGGSSPAAAPKRLTPQQRQAARKAERLAAAAAAREAAAAEAAKPCDEKGLATCAEMQACQHGKAPGSTTLQQKIDGWNSVTSADSLQALADAEAVLAEEIPKLAGLKENLPRLRTSMEEWDGDWDAWGCCIGCCDSPLDFYHNELWYIEQSEEKISGATATLSQCLVGFGGEDDSGGDDGDSDSDGEEPEEPLTIAQRCKLVVDFDEAAAEKRASLSDEELMAFEDYTFVGRLGLDDLAKVAEAKERLDNPSECTDFVRIGHMNTLLDDQEGVTPTFLDHYDASSSGPAMNFERRLQAAKLDRCINVELFKQLRDRQIAGESLTDVVQSQRTKMEASRAAYDAVVASENGLCTTTFNNDCNFHGNCPVVLTVAQINQLCREPEPDFHEELNRMTTEMSDEEITALNPHIYVWPIPNDLTMMDDPWGSRTKAGNYLTKARYAEPSSCVDIARYELEKEPAHDGYPFYFIQDFTINDGSIAQHLSESLGTAKLTKCITTKVYEQTPTAATRAAMDQAVTDYETQVQFVKDQNVCTTGWWQSDWGCQADTEKSQAWYSCWTPMPTTAPVPSPGSVPTAQITAECALPEPSFDDVAAAKAESMTYNQLFAYGERTPLTGYLPLSYHMMDQPIPVTDLAKSAVAHERYAAPSTCTDIVRGETLMAELDNTPYTNDYWLSFIDDFDVSSQNVLRNYEARLQAAKQAKCVSEKVYEQTPTPTNLAAKDTATSTYETIVSGGKGNGFCMNFFSCTPAGIALFTVDGPPNGVVC